MTAIYEENKEFNKKIEIVKKKSNSGAKEYIVWNNTIESFNLRFK